MDPQQEIDMVTTVTIYKGRDRGLKVAFFKNQARASQHAHALAVRFGTEAKREGNHFIVSGAAYFDSIDARHAS
jgi:hypothetical protein